MMKIKAMVVSGVEGHALYINDYRVAGPKPWGGGTEVASWEMSVTDIMTALSYMPDGDSSYLIDVLAGLKGLSQSAFVEHCRTMCTSAAQTEVDTAICEVISDLGYEVK